MFKNKITAALTVLIVLVGLSVGVSAQSKKSSGRVNVSFNELVEAARQGKSLANPKTIELVKNAYSEESDESIFGIGSIVGTWNCQIPMSDGGAAPFEALQTFNSDGSFVETSSLLGTGTEGPAHGVFESRRRGYILTFELFVFDPGTGESVGRVRVRNLIRMQGRDNFTSDNVVDFIEPDGTVIENIDSGTYTGRRMQVREL